MAEEGLPGFDYSAWVGVFAPAKTPPAIIAKLSADIAAVLNDPDTLQKIRAAGVEPMRGNAQDLARLLNTEIARAGEVVKAARLQPE